MSGQVATFATRFQEQPTPLGPIQIARGPFEVSASRGAVMVHRAEFADRTTLAALKLALEQATVAHEFLRAGNRYDPTSTATHSVAALEGREGES